MRLLGHCLVVFESRRGGLLLLLQGLLGHRPGCLPAASRLWLLRLLLPGRLWLLRLLLPGRLWLLRLSRRKCGTVGAAVHGMLGCRRRGRRPG